MVLIRLVGFLLLLAIGLCLGLFLYTRDRRYLRYAATIFKFGLVVAGVFALLYLLERLILVI
ncbi:hypothetical protein [Pelomicrobium methylotrophicum]|uniref:Uncharacterized protein n=1 Tax=Pelomicrobium methylotrophicum TaxID=2602750 RepID=A0A5C7F0F3_9PROT|nr:hypothetical protein [Pelomicrobium methylotrophicum]TXF13165.1 hypothetical protein FR698_03615 [Pelomicrobium methylotrophicum]